MATVVLLPGMDGSGELFGAFTAALDLLTPPRIVSYPPDRPLDYELLAELVRAAIPAYEPIILIAESFSGPIAIKVAASQPENLMAMVLVSTFVRSPVRIPRPLVRLIAQLPKSLIPTPIALRYALGADASPALLAQFKDVQAQVSSMAWRARIRSILEVNVADALDRIRVPMLCLSATRDRVISRSAAAALTRRLPGLDKIEIDGPHFLLQTRAAECAMAVRSWAQEKGLTI